MTNKPFVLKLMTLLLLCVILASCGSEEPADENATLTVVSGDNETIYSRADLEALSSANLEAEGSTYVGVPLVDLLRDAGVEPEAVSSVSAVATDGFSASYEPDLFLSPQTIVAYATTEGNLATDEQPFRMVVPDQPGRMNVRMLARVEVTQ
jgi:DMSO/TMAO reductase YedYZ molybdopterin-dependent catalytic subunit